MIREMDGMSSRDSRRDSLTDALLRVVAERGLDAVSVREVAAEAGVAIGTVQYYFPTKDEMLAHAFAEVVRRIRRRLDHVMLGADLRQNLARVLSELLPLDRARTEEARVVLAFAARAMIAPELARIQRGILADITTALGQAIVGAEADRTARAQAKLTAQLALAAVDGLALHAVSSGGVVTRQRLEAALDRLLDALLR